MFETFNSIVIPQKFTYIYVIIIMLSFLNISAPSYRNIYRFNISILIHNFTYDRTLSFERKIINSILCSCLFFQGYFDQIFMLSYIDKVFITFCIYISIFEIIFLLTKKLGYGYIQCLV